MADPISPANRFTIAAEPFGAADSDALRAELARELADRYCGSGSRCFERRLETPA